MTRILIFALALLSPFALEARLTCYLTGNRADVTPTLHGPLIHLAGGGGDNDAIYQEVINRLRGCDDCGAKIDIVILRASGADGYNDYLYALDGVDSVETFVITDRLSSAIAEVVTAVRNAEYVFFAGGDQCNYVILINGSPIEAAVREVFARGGAVGGTSAGMAIQGSASYDACNDASAKSNKALADPYNDEISFTHDFFDWAALENVITDTHFVERDRMGRLLAFIARQLRDGPTSGSFLGLAANAATSVIIDHSGRADVMGLGPAYFVLGDHFPERTLPGQSLTYCGYKIWRRQTGESFQLLDRPNHGFYTVDVNDGTILRNPY